MTVRTKMMMILAGSTLMIGLPVTAQNASPEPGEMPQPDPAPASPMPAEVPAPSMPPETQPMPEPMPAPSPGPQPPSAATPTMAPMVAQPAPPPQAVYPPCSATVQDQCTNTRAGTDRKRMRRPG
jgi:outer membrane biosynthesis protein TonB